MATPDLKTIRRYGNIMEAELALMLLKGAGINAILADEVLAASVGTAFVPTGMRLQVPQEEMARAEEILETAPTEIEMPVEFATQEIDEEPGKLEAALPLILTCTGCGATWELTEAERRERSDFKCPDCGTVNSKAGEEASAENQRSWREQITDLAKSKEAWRLLVILTGIHIILMRVWDNGVVNLLPPYRQTRYDAYYWQETLYRLYHALIYAPVAETLLLGIVITLLAALGAPLTTQILAGAAGPCLWDGSVYWQHGAAVIPAFLLMSWAYTYWRRKSWIQAMLFVMAMHTCYNATLYVRIVTNQIKRDIASRRQTGSYFGLDDAYREFIHGRTLYYAGDYAHAADTLREAASRDNSNGFAYTFLAWAEMRQGKYAEAGQASAMAVQVDPGNWEAWMGQGFVLLYQKRNGEAVDAGERAVALAPEWQRADAMKELAELRADVRDATPPLSSPIRTGS